MAEPWYAVENRKLKQLKINPFFERERERARGKGTLVTRKGNFGNVSGNFCNDDRELW